MAVTTASKLAPMHLASAANGTHSVCTARASMQSGFSLGASRSQDMHQQQLCLAQHKPTHVHSATSINYTYLAPATRTLHTQPQSPQPAGPLSGDVLAALHSTLLMADTLMRAVVVYGPNWLVVLGAKDALNTGEPPPGVSTEGAPKPIRQPGEVMIKACSTSVNPVDVGMFKGTMKPPKGYPKVLGGDVAGTVDADGADEGSKFKPGDRVVALTPGFYHTQEGTWQDYSSVEEHMIARLPDSLPLKTAGGIPLVTLTAWQALQEGTPRPFKRVLVHAAAGGVGSFAVQIAKALGMYVAGTAGPNNLDFVRQELGADEAIDYTQPHWEQAFKDQPFDIVVDSMGVRGDAIKKSLAVLKVPGGHLSHIMNEGTDQQLLARIAEDHANRKGPSVSTTFVQPNGQQLQQVLELMEQGKVKLFVDKVLPLERALEGIKYVDEGHTRGKMVLVMRDEEEELAPAGGAAGRRT